MMHLDEKAKEAAHVAFGKAFGPYSGKHMVGVDAAVLAYLQTAAATPDVDGLMAEWRDAMDGVTPGPWTLIPACEYDGDDDGLAGAYTSPASIEGSDGNPVCTFGSEDGSGTLFENEANHHFVERCSPDNISALLDDLSSERAAHEQTKRERDALKESIGGHISRGAQLSADAAAARKAASQNLVRAEAAEARITELEKALPFVVQYRRNDDGILWIDIAAFDLEGPAERYCQACAEKSTYWEYRVYRRALGGKADD